MARFVEGDVVTVPFPPSHPGSPLKNRPAIVVAVVPFGAYDDYMLCLVTTQFALDPHMIPLNPADIENGSLSRQSYIRPTYLWTCEEGFITRKIGTLKTPVLEQVRAKLASLFS